MAIAFDASSGTSNSGGTLNYTHTVSGVNAFIFTSAFSNGGTIGTVTCGGVAMTLMGSTGLGPHHTFWYLAGPTLGNNTISVKESGTSNTIESFSESYIGVSQGTPNGTQIGTISSSTTPAGTITTTVDKCWILMGAINANGGTLTAGANTTLRIGGNGGRSGIFDSNSVISPAGAGTLNANWANPATNWSVGMVSIAPAPTSGYLGKYLG